MYCTWLSGTVCLIVSPITVEYKGSGVQHGCDIKSKVYQLLFVTSERDSWLGFTWRSNRSTRRSYSLSLCCICCVNPLRVDVNRLCQIWGKQVNGGVIQNIWIYLRLTLLWYLWSQTLQNSCAIPSFLSILTVTELSWWQNRQVNVVSCDAKVSKQQHFWWGKLTYLEALFAWALLVFWRIFCVSPCRWKTRVNPGCGRLLPNPALPKAGASL